MALSKVQISVLECMHENWCVYKFNASLLLSQRKKNIAMEKQLYTPFNVDNVSVIFFQKHLTFLQFRLCVCVLTKCFYFI